MFSSKQAFLSVTLIGVVLCVSTVTANYLQPDLFPIGFTGFSFTWYWTNEGQPYPDSTPYPYGTWQKEKELLELTHCNFIGCSDAWHRFDKYITLNYTELENQTI